MPDGKVRADLLMERQIQESGYRCQFPIVEPSAAFSIVTTPNGCNANTQEYTEVTRFGRRLATVSLFTAEPQKFSIEIRNFLKKNNYDDRFSVTWSSVAVDIIPKGFNKLKGLRQAAGNLKIIGIADSVNDLPLLKGADYSFAPSNLAKEAEKVLRNYGIKIVSINESISELSDSTLYKANFEDAKGVSEILRFLKRIFSSVS